MGDVVGSVESHGCELLEYAWAPSLLPERPASAPTMWRYRSLLPLDEGPVRYPLPVGGTPLLPVPALRRELGMTNLWLKDETRGPSASNKDRATALVIESGLRRGADVVTTASTGNAALATAVGAAAAGIRAVIFVPAGCDRAKVRRMTGSGAVVFQVREGYAAAFALSRLAAHRLGWIDRNTGVNPLTIEAKKTVAFEIWEQLGTVPDVVIVPVGDGPTLCGMAKGFRELLACGVSTRLPRLIGVQARGCDPLERRWRDAPPGPSTRTIADGIAVDHPATGDLALADVRASGGAFVAVSDDDMLEAVRLLAVRAGVAAEPAGAASLAGLLACAGTQVRPDETAVLLVTGRGQGHGGDSGPDGSVLISGQWESFQPYLAGFDLA